jgi:RHS repeat-associated protein
MWQSPMDVARTTPPPVADLNMDGVVNSTDSALWTDLLYSTSNTSVYADTDLDWDGQDDWNSQGIDSDLFSESYNANLGLSGVGRVSSPGVANRTGYAGYQWDQTISAYHVRYRVYLPDIGRWTRRDPLGRVDGHSMCGYLGSLCQPLRFVDSHGLSATDASSLVTSPELRDSADCPLGWYYDTVRMQCVRDRLFVPGLFPYARVCCRQARLGRGATWITHCELVLTAQYPTCADWGGGDPARGEWAGISEQSRNRVT